MTRVKVLQSWNEYMDWLKTRPLLWSISWTRENVFENQVGWEDNMAVTIQEPIPCGMGLCAYCGQLREVDVACGRCGAPSVVP